MPEETPRVDQSAQAHRLVGLTLKTGWVVVEKYERHKDATGGKYSVCYGVEKNGKRAFLKALDFSRAMEDRTQELTRALQALLEAYNFERDVLLACAEKKMDRVIAAIESGEVEVDATVLGRVPYLIFEEAEGDIRSQLAKQDSFDITLKLRALHHIATGLFQLHGAGVAHQDLKPSNVLRYGEISKVSDLGSASVKGRPGPADERDIAGTKVYAPPELLYGYRNSDFNARRFGCDAYLLGSMVVFLFTGMSATAGIFVNLAEQFLPDQWSGTYPDVLPYVRNAFDIAVQSWAKEFPGQQSKGDLTRIVRELCEPDPTLRGHPRNRIGMGNRYSVERYVTTFDRLALSARIGSLR
jgi:serine/threonine protein kinase